jgi:hypothetical protein
VPPGIWSAEEYAKLPRHDGDVPDQAMAGADGLFFCHTGDGFLCAGWVGCHDMISQFAVRIHARFLDLPAIYDYVSPVPLFKSGAEAALHGISKITDPAAVRAAQRYVLRFAARRVALKEDNRNNRGDQQ